MGVVEAVAEEDGVKLLELGPFVAEDFAGDRTIIGGSQHGTDGGFGEHDISLSHSDQLCTHHLLVEGDVVADEIGGLLEVIEKPIQHRAEVFAIFTGHLVGDAVDTGCSPRNEETLGIDDVVVGGENVVIGIGKDPAQLDHTGPIAQEGAWGLIVEGQSCGFGVEE